MANKRLQSLIFPGLADTYTIPQDFTDLQDYSTVMDNIGSAIAIIANGDTHIAIDNGQYVYVKEHNTLTEGLYINDSGSNIAANAALSNSNLTAVSGGGLNDLKAEIVENLPFKSKIIKGNSSWRSSPTGVGLSNPYSILIIGYETVDIVNAVTASSPLGGVNHLASATAVTSTDGTLKFGSDANRQFIVIYPPCIDLIQQ